MKTTQETPKIYVASLSDYNNGRLVGEWFDISDYSNAEELTEAVQDYLKGITEEEKDGELREEWAIHDFENFPKSLYSEYMGFDELYEYWDAVGDMDEETAEAFEIFCDNSGEEMNADTKERFEEAYQGCYDGFNPREDFAEQLIDDCYNLDQIMGNLASYFDYEKFARDLFMGDYWEEKGYVFRNI